MRYPAGWQRSISERLDCHEEFLVLDGALEINGRLYEKHTYAFLPAGYLRARASSRHGCVLLDLFYGAPNLQHAAGSQHASSAQDASSTQQTRSPASFDERLLVEYVNPLAMEWDPGLVDPQLARAGPARDNVKAGIGQMALKPTVQPNAVIFDIDGELADMIGHARTSPKPTARAAIDPTTEAPA